MQDFALLPGLRTRRAATIIATAMLSIAALLAPAPRAHSQEMIPDLSSARRIVAISGDVTEIVYALGEKGRLVARDSTSLFPKAAMALPDVGYMRALSPEGVLSVNPDAVLASKGSGPPEAIDVLGKASVPLVFVPEGFDEKAILAKIMVIGQALGVPGKAAALSARVEADLADAKARTANIAQRKRVLFILSLQGGKVLAAGSDTAAAGVIELAGAINAVEGFSGYKALTDEAIVSARPDVILMMDRAGSHDAGDADFAAHPALSQTPAVKSGMIVKMDGGYLLGFGPRTADAVRDLARAFYGDAIVN